MRIWRYSDLWRQPVDKSVFYPPRDKSGVTSSTPEAWKSVGLSGKFETRAWYRAQAKTGCRRHLPLVLLLYFTLREPEKPVKTILQLCSMRPWDLYTPNRYLNLEIRPGQSVSHPSDVVELVPA